ncbi:uncharacterized protein [Mobula birostris]|uniref:uncharacterized protein n=1 Tax=Mobula birostris TaxID=1983395 RepID=UPI003B289AEC
MENERLLVQQSKDRSNAEYDSSSIKYQNMFFTQLSTVIVPRTRAAALPIEENDELIRCYHGDQVPCDAFGETALSPRQDDDCHNVHYGLTPTYSVLNFRRDEPLIKEIEDPPVTSEPEGQPLTARTGADKQEPRENIGDRSYRKICPSCLVTFSVIAIVAGLSIHVLQIRQSLIASDQKYQRLLEEYQEMNRTQRQRRLQNDELNSTLEYRTTENSRLDLSLRTCLKNVSVLESKLLVLESNHSTLENKVLVLESNLSVLSSNLSDQRQMQTHLLDNFRHLEMKYGTLNETKAEICQLLSSRKEKCPLVSCTRRKPESSNAGNVNGTMRFTLAVRNNTISSARSLPVGVQIVLKRSKLCVNSPRGRLDSNDNTLFLPISLSDCH